MNTSSEFRPSGASILPFWLSTKSAVIEFRCRGTPQGRKIATNNFGSREMSAKLMLSLSFSSGRWCTHILSHLLGLKVDHWLCYNAFLQLTAPLP